MTRENKLALVVGFGLILFVGILISDHFSIVRNQQVADLTQPVANETLVTRTSESTLIDLTPRQATPAVSPGAMTNSGANTPIDPVQPEHRTMIDPNGRPVSETVTLHADGQITVPGFTTVAPEPPAIQVKFHNVQAGETLYSICRTHYGDTSLVKALAKHNKMDDPASMRVGRRLMIPSAEELGGQPAKQLPITVVGGTPNASQTTSPKPSATKTYTVQAGDSLGEIAQRLLGSSKKWKQLHDMNRDVIEDPDNIRVGTVLKVL